MNLKVTGHAVLRFCERTGQHDRLKGMLELHERLAIAKDVPFSEVCKTFTVLSNKRKARFLIWYEDRIHEHCCAVVKEKDVVTILTEQLLQSRTHRRKVWWAAKMVHGEGKYLDEGKWNYVNGHPAGVPDGVSGVLGSDRSGAVSVSGVVEGGRVCVLCGGTHHLGEETPCREGDVSREQAN